MTKQYLEPHQARTREPSRFEDLLGDSIERCYSAKIHDLPAIVAYLNEQGPPSPFGDGEWTEENFRELMADLGR